MPPPPKPPPKPPAKPDQALRRRLTSDGFQVSAPAAPMVSLAGGGAEMEYAKSIAGITRRLLDHGPVPKDLTEEMSRLVATNPPGLAVLWQDLVRLLLAPPAPTSPQEAANDSRNIRGTLEPTLLRLPQSQSRAMERLRDCGVGESDLFRGAHIVLDGRGSVYESWSEWAQPRRGPGPYPGVADPVMEMEIRSVGILVFGRTPDGGTWLQMQTHVEALRKALPKLWAFIEKYVVKTQAVGPMGCSPRTLQSGKPVIVLKD